MSLSGDSDRSGPAKPPPGWALTCEVSWRDHLLWLEVDAGIASIREGTKEQRDFGRHQVLQLNLLDLAKLAMMIDCYLHTLAFDAGLSMKLTLQPDGAIVVGPRWWAG